MARSGQITSNEREDIERRIKFALNLSEDLSDDWFTQNASPELLKKVSLELDKEKQENILLDLLESL